MYVSFHMVFESRKGYISCFSVPQQCGKAHNLALIDSETLSVCWMLTYFHNGSITTIVVWGLNKVTYLDIVISIVVKLHWRSLCMCHSLQPLNMYYKPIKCTKRSLFYTSFPLYLIGSNIKCVLGQTKRFLRGCENFPPALA